MQLIWHFKSFQALNSLELYQIMQLRIEVFVVEQNCLYNECDAKDFKCSHLWATNNGEVVAYARIVPPEVSYKEPSIGRIVTRKSFRKYGLGHQLLKNAIEICENHYHQNPIRISAQSYLVNFYAQYGFKVSSEEYLEDGLPHTEMLKA